ncbi:MAG: hypothetical protein HOY79_30150 [Streptomyces sp.]|nr:hypothetical protein [Streptomyces sp.]
MSMPPPPQSPYGPQNPYGLQPPPAPQGSHAAGSYGQPPAPQPPYGSAPYPQQQPYGWGVPPMAAPPPKRQLGLILGIVGGALALIVAIVVGLAMVGATVTGAGFPEAKFTLDLPKTLVNGRYELTQDHVHSQEKKLEDEADGAWDAKDVRAVVGHYAPAGDHSGGTLVVEGMYGRFSHPALTRKQMMSGAADGNGAKMAVPAKDFHLDGSGGVVITCEVLTQSKLGVKVTVPLCGWFDDNTGASVAQVATAAVSQDPSDVDLEKAAATTLQIRSEMRKPLG